MARHKTFYYLVDNMNPERVETMKKALRTVPDIESITIKTSQGMVEIIASRDVEDSLKIACDVAGTTFRTKVKKGKIRI
ncbi:MAG TPA: hypothetical protein ENN41_04880 [Sediminispirochaeta sp.]|nr:hypothetical protein [Sediminispirochaeta sp.]